MPHRSQPSAPAALAAVVDECLQRLRILSLDLNTYGNADNAAILREIVDELERARPLSLETAEATEFIVAETFTIRRSEVASLLCRAFERRKRDPWFRVAEFVKPPAFHFRASPCLIVRTSIIRSTKADR